ncbi:hypothetical protein ACNHYB_08815 [Isoptericola jiangsuensis]|uniref:hypothetical protein n=1 Tax=Isoptericola jiangsuensis TaxID=548579 RepID=UPI003AAAF860
MDAELDAAVAFLGSRGFLHLDAHFENVLTDGHRFYLADFGLALSSRFDLAPDDAAFVEAHLDHDRAYVATHLVTWLAVAFRGLGPEERRAFVRSCAVGVPPEGVPPGVAALLLRHAPVAAVMGDFHRAFRQESREASFPREAIRRALSLPPAGPASA